MKRHSGDLRVFYLVLVTARAQSSCSIMATRSQYIAMRVIASMGIRWLRTRLSVRDVTGSSTSAIFFNCRYRQNAMLCAMFPAAQECGRPAAISAVKKMTRFFFPLCHRPSDSRVRSRRIWYFWGSAVSALMSWNGNWLLSRKRDV